MQKLVLIGAGEFAEIAYEYFTHDSEYEVVAFAINGEFIETHDKCGLPIIAFEDVESQFPPSEVDAFVAIPASDLNQLRKRLYFETKAKGYNLANYVSSQAFVWHNVKMGDNCFIFEDNTVQPFVELGSNIVMWSGNHLGHRTVVEDHAFITSHAVISGYCRIGESSFIGVNATFNDGTEVAKNCIVGSGALVTKNLVVPGAVYFGNPAKQLAKKSAFDVRL